MAQPVPCPTCSNPLDPNADCCPRCGRKDPHGQTFRRWLTINAFGIAVAIGVGWYLVKVLIPNMQQEFTQRARK